MNVFCDEMRREPYPMYAKIRSGGGLFRVPPPFDAWMICDYETVRRVLGDHETFSSRVPAPRNWFLFSDPPEHTKLRGLISRAFTPRVIANLEPRIRELSRQLLDMIIDRGEMDLAADYAVPLPMKVISGMIGVPPEEWAMFKRWSDTILELSYTRSGGEAAEQSLAEFVAVTAEMNAYLTEMIARRRTIPGDDLLAHLIAAELDGVRLTQEEILGFFQLLVVGGQETTANLINNAILCFLEHPDQLARLRERTELLPSAIEEVLRYRSPLQWLMRTPRREVELQGQLLRPGQLVLAVIGSANRDEKQFAKADRFDIARAPNAHVAFGHGSHFCLGAALSRMEARIALTDLLTRLKDLQLAGDEPWEPRRALHVHGPSHLPVRFRV